MADDLVRWAIVGAGWIARDYVAPAIRASHNGTLVAVADPDPKACDRLNVQSFTDLDAMLDWGEFETLYVATPNHLHTSQSIAAIRAGKAVLCEKPTALTADEAQRMADAAEAEGVLLATAYDQRWHGAHLKLREMIAAGDLGSVTTVRIRYACWTGRDWNPVPELPHDNWRVDPKRAGGGATIDLAPHGLDLTQMLVGERIEMVHCLLQHRVHTDVPVDDGGVIIGRTTGGILHDHSVSYNCPETFPRRRLEVIGTKAMAVAIDTMGQTPGGSLTLIDASDGSERQIDFSSRDRSPFLNQIEAFADAVLGRTTWKFPIDRDVETMRLLDQCSDASPDREGGVLVDRQKTLPHGRGSHRFQDKFDDVLGYFITFTTYGTWLQGRSAGSADRRGHNIPGEPYLVGDETKERLHFQRLKHEPVVLHQAAREAVQDAVVETCRHRSWTLHALHVRSNHLHAVVAAGETTPEHVMNDLKSYATRMLRRRGAFVTTASVWTRHGSTRYLKSRETLEAAIEYTVHRQGKSLLPLPLVSVENPASPDREEGVSGGRPEPLPHGRGSQSGDAS